MKLTRKYIIPRRHWPEMFTVAGLVLVRKYVRFMRRYTDMPVGFAVPVNAELVADILLMRELYWHEPRGRSWCVAAQREEIRALVDNCDFDSAICTQVAQEIAEEGKWQELSDDLVDSVIDGYEYTACSGIIQHLGDIENPRSPSEYHRRAHALRDQVEEEAALAAYDSAVEAAPNDIIFRRSRAHLLESQGRFIEAAEDRQAACQSAAEKNDPFWHLEALYGLCYNSYKRQSMPEFVPAFEKLAQVAGRITFETEWDHEGKGTLGEIWDISGSFVVELLTLALKLGAPKNPSSPDRMLMRRLTAARDKLLILRRMYCP